MLGPLVVPAATALLTAITTATILLWRTERELLVRGADGADEGAVHRMGSSPAPQMIIRVKRLDLTEPGTVRLRLRRLELELSIEPGEQP